MRNSKRRTTRHSDELFTTKNQRTADKRSGMRRPDDERIDWQQIVWELEDDGVSTIADSFREDES